MPISTLLELKKPSVETQGFIAHEKLNFFMVPALLLWHHLRSPFRCISASLTSSFHFQFLLLDKPAFEFCRAYYKQIVVPEFFRLKNKQLWFHQKARCTLSIHFVSAIVTRQLRRLREGRNCWKKCARLIRLHYCVRFRYTRVRYRNIKNHLNFYKLFFFTELILLVCFMVILFVLIQHLNFREVGFINSLGSKSLLKRILRT